MEKIELEAKTDRELLVMVVLNQNELCTITKRHGDTLYNNGWGLVSQVKVIWGLAGAIWTLVLIYARQALAN